MAAQQPPSAPAEDTTNWVGLLHEYRTAYPWNGSPEVPYIQIAVNAPGNPSRRATKWWRYQIRLEKEDVTYPPESDTTSFKTKKEAKRYAARLAVLWLRDSRWMPRTGHKFPPNVPNRHRPHTMPQFVPQSVPTPVMSVVIPATLPYMQGGSPAPSPSASPSSSTTSSNLVYPPPEDSDPSPCAQVAELCRALGLPAPKWNLYLEGQDDNGRERWSGSVDFGDETALLPFDVSELKCEGIIAKKYAKECIAYDLLKLLKREKDRRIAENAAFLAGSAVPSPGAMNNPASPAPETQGPGGTDQDVPVVQLPPLVVNGTNYSPPS